MLDMIENLLTFADLAAGKRTLREEVFNLSQLIQESKSSVSAQLQSKKLEVFSYISSAIPSEIKADREHIRQIIKHLLSNAIKFTNNGLIYIEVERKIRRDDTGEIQHLVISVHDSGIGIEQTKLNKIFDSFTQLDMANTRSFEGTGMGLTLARQMSLLIGGHLYAESKPAVGSSFYFSLPLHEIRQQLEANQITQSPLAGKTSGHHLTLRTRSTPDSVAL